MAQTIQQLQERYDAALAVSKDPKAKGTEREKQRLRAIELRKELARLHKAEAAMAAASAPTTLTVADLELKLRVNSHAVETLLKELQARPVEDLGKGLSLANAHERVAAYIRHSITESRRPVKPAIFAFLASTVAIPIKLLKISLHQQNLRHLEALRIRIVAGEAVDKKELEPVQKIEHTYEKLGDYEDEIFKMVQAFMSDKYKNGDDVAGYQIYKVVAEWFPKHRDEFLAFMRASLGDNAYDKSLIETMDTYFQATSDFVDLMRMQVQWRDSKFRAREQFKTITGLFQTFHKRDLGKPKLKLVETLIANGEAHGKFVADNLALIKTFVAKTAEIFHPTLDRTEMLALLDTYCAQITAEYQSLVSGLRRSSNT